MALNTPGGVRSRYIGLWLFYIGLVAVFLGMAFWLAEASGLSFIDELYGNFATFSAYLLIGAGAIVSVIGYVIKNR